MPPSASNASRSRAQQERSPSLFDPENDAADASPSATPTAVGSGSAGAEEDAQAIKRRRGLEAQRAFRKRKAAHLQDLERKVALYEVENAQLKGENGRLKEENHWLRRQLGESQEGVANTSSAGETPNIPDYATTNGMNNSAPAAATSAGSKKRKSSLDGSTSGDDHSSSTTSTIHHALQHALHPARNGAVLPSVMMPSPSRAASLASILQAAEHADAYSQQEQRQSNEAAASEKINGRHPKRQALSSSQGGRTTLPPIPAMPVMDESSPYFHQQHNRLPATSLPSTLTPLLLSPGRSCDSPPSLPLPNPTHLSQHAQERPIHYSSQRQHHSQNITSPPSTYPAGVLRGGASGSTYLPSSRRSSGEDYGITGRDTSRGATPSLSYSSFPSTSIASTTASQSLSSYPDSGNIFQHQHHQGLPTPLSSALLPASSASKAACCNGIIDCPDIPEASDGKYRDRRRSESIMRPAPYQQHLVYPEEEGQGQNENAVQAEEAVRQQGSRSPEQLPPADGVNGVTKATDTVMDLQDSTETETKPRISDERSSSASSTH